MPILIPIEIFVPKMFKFSFIINFDPEIFAALLLFEGIGYLKGFFSTLQSKQIIFLYKLC